MICSGELESFMTIRSGNVVRRLAMSFFGNPWTNGFFLSRRFKGGHVAEIRGLREEWPKILKPE
jgi:hypothetical protein